MNSLIIIALLWMSAGIVLLPKSAAMKGYFAFAIAILATILIAFLAFGSASIENVHDFSMAFGQVSFHADALGISLAFIASSIGSLCILFSWEYMAGQPQLGRYYAFILLFLGAMIGLVLTNSFLLLFFFWELTALCSYALIAFESDNPEARAGGTRALIVTQIGGLGLLLTALLVYQMNGNYEIEQFLASFSSYPEVLKIILAFGILAAAAAKSAQIPFQTWLAGAMEAPSPISALIHAATMVNAGVYLLIRLYPAFEEVAYWKEAVVTVGMLSALGAGILALASHDLKQLLAYSTISQLGYMVYALGLGALAATELHLVSHAIFKALLFLSAGAIIHNLGTRDMWQMGGLWGKEPFVRTVMIIGLAALVGIPIANGFWSKELILEAGLHDGGWTYWFMLSGVVLTASYSFRMFFLVFLGNSKTEPKHATGSVMKFALALLGLAVLLSYLPIEETDYPFTNAEMMMEIVYHPATYLALAMIVLGAALTMLRHRYMVVFDGLHGIFESELGFKALNNGFLWIAQQAATMLSRSQTGIFNWNALAILMTLLLMLLLRGGMA